MLVNERLKQAYKPKTWSTYRSMFLTFMAFCEFMSCECINPAAFTIVAFIEFLVATHLKFSSILNYLSAIKSHSKWLNLPTQSFDHPRIKLMLKAVQNSATQGPKFKPIFDIDTPISLQLLLPSHIHWNSRLFIY